MISKPELLGVWTVQNPDRGETLPTAESRILTGGMYHFLANDMVNVNLEFRDGAGGMPGEALVARFRIEENGAVALDFIGGHSETFEPTGADHLHRTGITRPAIEGGVSLVRVIE